MQLMKETDKKQINGGIAPMLLWIIIMGVSMAISAITHTTTAIIDAKQSHNQQADSKKSHYYSSKSSNGYVRLSPYPSRSTMMMPL